MPTEHPFPVLEVELADLLPRRPVPQQDGIREGALAPDVGVSHSQRLAVRTEIAVSTIGAVRLQAQAVEFVLALLARHDVQGLQLRGASDQDRAAIWCEVQQVVDVGDLVETPALESLARGDVPDAQLLAEK